MTPMAKPHDIPEDQASAADEQTLAGAINDVGAQDPAAELAAANDRLLRLQAEMQNLRNRTAREIADERRYAALPVVRELLPVVDNIERAIEAAEKAGEAETLLEGFRLVRQQLLTLLDHHHCERIEALGQPFDPHFHEALLTQPSDSAESGAVLEVVQRGYRVGDRVVRPAKVIVAE